MNDSRTRKTRTFLPLPLAIIGVSLLLASNALALDSYDLCKSNCLSQHEPKIKALLKNPAGPGETPASHRVLTLQALDELKTCVEACQTTTAVTTSEPTPAPAPVPAPRPKKR